MDNKNNKTESPNDDWIAYLPADEIRTFEHIYNNVQKARDYFRQAQENVIQVNEFQNVAPDELVDSWFTGFSIYLDDANPKKLNSSRSIVMYQ